MRQTATHVFFWHGPLSNWHLGVPFQGSRAYEETVALLNTAGVPRPGDAALSSRMLRLATFACGEQWMMATKSWILDGNLALKSEDPSTNAAEALRCALLEKEPAPGKPGHRIWKSPLAQVLRTASPKDQKAIGRAIKPYDDALWGQARVHCVAGGSIARFEADRNALRTLLSTGDRTLVEGSPVDEIWGVKLRFDDPRIDDPRNWRGLNLLGEALEHARSVLSR